MSEKEKCEAIIKNLQEIRKEFKDMNDRIDERKLDEFIDNNEEKIYEAYCETFPEMITSDFTIENIPDIHEFVENYMSEELEKMEKRK